MADILEVDLLVGVVKEGFDLGGEVAERCRFLLAVAGLVGGRGWVGKSKPIIGSFRYSFHESTALQNIHEIINASLLNPSVVHEFAGLKPALAARPYLL